MKKAFTITELMVAIALMAAVMAGTGYVFKVAVDAQRMSNATAEIMRNLRGITDQLNSDFAGLQTDAPMAIWFDQDADDPNIRVDQIMFFSSGDFSTYREWGTSTNIIRSNTARIYYGQARCRDTNDHDILRNPNTRVGVPDDGISRTSKGRRNIWLARNQHVLTVDDKLTGEADWPDWQVWPQFETSFNALTNPTIRIKVNPHDIAPIDEPVLKNAFMECDKGSLSQWRNIPFDSFKNSVIPVCFSNRIQVVPENPDTLHNLLAQNISSFAVQWGYYYDDGTIKEWRWWPASNDDFARVTANDFLGVYFNVANPVQFGDWYRPIDIQYDNGNAVTNFPDGFFPRAIKFTFRLYDSKGIIKNGLRFTHIVYLKQ